MEELQRQGARNREEAELLHREVTTADHLRLWEFTAQDGLLPSPPQNSRHRQEVLDLSTRNLELSSSNAELSADLHHQQGAVRLLEEELSTQRDQVRTGADII